MLTTLVQNQISKNSFLIDQIKITDPNKDDLILKL